MWLRIWLVLTGRNLMIQSLKDQWIFFSFLINFINHQHWTLEYENEFIKSFYNKLPIKIDFETLRNNFKMIYSIKFYNSMCFIYKGHISNDVGVRAARGKMSPIIKPGNEDSELIKKMSN